MPVLTGRPILPMMPEQLAIIIHGLFNFSNQSSHNIFILTQFSANAQKNWIFGKNNKILSFAQKIVKNSDKKIQLSYYRQSEVWRLLFILKKSFLYSDSVLPTRNWGKNCEKMKKMPDFKKNELIQKRLLRMIFMYI